MSKYLDLTGLGQYTEGVKKYVSGNYLKKNEKITIGDTTVDDKVVSIDSENGSVNLTTKETVSIDVVGSGGSSQLNPNLIKLINGSGTVAQMSVENLKAGGLTAENGKVTASSFVKIDSNNDRVLLGGGGDLAMNVANGIAKLNDKGKLSKDLIELDTTVFEVVTKLPETDIYTSKIYLVKTGDTSQNMYSEYIYTGDTGKGATYDKSKWEKLGDFRSEVDLVDYSKKSETVKEFENVVIASAGAKLAYKKADDTTGSVIIPRAFYNTATSTYTGGIMTANDKKVLDTLAKRYPLSISGISASPNLVEVGVAADVTFAWSIANEDFHPVSSQTISVAGGAAQTVAVGTKSYKQTALAGATTATTKSATVTIKSDSTTLTKDVTVTYHYPTYIGVMANGATVNETSVKALTKSIEWGKGKKTTLTQNNQIIVYAYPASYGNLTSVKDGNGFEGFAGYTKQTMTINSQTYNVYVQNIAATSSSTYTFA